ncbi:MAG: Ammonia channel precursor [bacterium ADurb.Bin236]|nr:MAG: Ammonia channel precursor [bacterium ADurb.Bin236]HPN94926.1 ammonium transporter [bacterium]
MKFRKIAMRSIMFAAPLLAVCATAFGDVEAAPTVQSNAEQIAASQTSINTVWMLVCAFLVFFMQPGFAMLEVGFTRAKNAANILMKNLMDFSIGSLAYWAIGFGIMFGASRGGLFGTSGFFLSDGDPSTGDGMWKIAFWLFQVVFAATAATIVSGAMAERTKFKSYIFYCVFICALIYPVVGHWVWGGGWLSKLGMIDFAGSAVVHSVGGWCALAGAIAVGPRLGKYGPNGQVNAIPGHNIPLAALGVFILWFGWFGFNAGSTTSGMNLSIGVIAVTTNLAAAAGAVAAMIMVWIWHGKPDTSMTLNGALAGLVGITAPCANVSPSSAVIIGAVAGVLVVLAVEFVDRILKIDDPVGAISVHGVCGAWGTLAAGLFAQSKYGGVDGLFFGGGFSQLGVQALGVVSVFAWSFISASVLFAVIKIVVGLRVSPEEELRGLDIEEHGIESYSGFQIFTTQ